MRTLVLTFDNLGEAAEQERGVWRGPVGGHPSVAVALPALLDLLDELDLRTTFFVEAVNAQRYPEAVLEIAARGHEVGQHGWQHERWAQLDDATQADLLGRSSAAWAALGVETQGFRPPGGKLTPHGLDHLARAGIRWCSPVGEQPFLDGSGVAVVPFRWSLVDAVYLYEPFAGRRRDLGLGDAVLDAQSAARRLEDELARDPATLVLHPFLGADEAVRAAIADLLRRLAARRSAGELRIVPGHVVATELRGGA